MRAPAESERRHGKRAGELDPQTFLSVSAGLGAHDKAARLRHLHAFARANDMACYVWTVRRRPMIAGIVRSGFSLVNGPGVMCDVSQPFRAGAAPSR